MLKAQNNNANLLQQKGKVMITIDDVIDMLQKFRRKYEISNDRKSITFFFDNGDRTLIGIGDDHKSVSMSGQIIGNLEDLENWIYWNHP